MRCYHKSYIFGATTLSIITFNIMRLSIMTLSIMTHNIITLIMNTVNK
jgi:hypothetical protein